MKVQSNNRYHDLLSAFVANNPLVEMVILPPSLSVLVFLRTWLGFRFVKPWLVGLLAILLVALSGASFLTGSVHNPFAPNSTASHSHVPALLVFTMLMAGLAWYHRRKGWRLIFTNDWHIMSRGKSHLAKWLPFNEATIQRKIEPIVCYLVGLLFVVLSSPGVGIWIMFSGATLAVSESLVWQTGINEMLDRHDARVETKAAKEVDAIVKNGGQPKKISVGQSGGVPMPVMLAPELQALLDNPMTA